MSGSICTSDSDEDDESYNESLQKLRAAIAAKPRDYASHVSYIHLLRQAGDLDALRAARVSFRSKFLCPEVLWLEWLEDENRLATNESVNKELLRLHETSTEDYMSVKIWLQRLRFERELLRNGSITHERFQATCAECLDVAGSSLPDASELWSVVREAYEDLDENRSRVLDLFVRQLGIPLAGSEGVLETFESWVKRGDQVEEKCIREARRLHSKAIRLRYAREEREAQLKALSTERDDQEALEAAWLEYVVFEEKEFETAYIDSTADRHAYQRMVCVYERAIAEVPFKACLWQRYAQMLERVNAPAKKRLRVYQRSVRDAPASCLLQVGLLRASERFFQTNEIAQDAEMARYHALVEACLTADLPSGNEYVNYFLAYCGVVRRRGTADACRWCFSFCISKLSNLFPQWDMGKVYIYRYEANYEVSFGSIDRARAAWEKIMHNNEQKWAFWDAYINMERNHGNVDAARALFYRAFSFNLDSLPSLFHTWEAFENECGSLDALDASNAKIASARLKLQQTGMAPAVSPGVSLPKPSADAKKKRKALLVATSSSNAKRPHLEGALSATASPSPFTLYICNLATHITQGDIEQLFSGISGYMSTRLIVKKEDGTCRGFGYVDFENEEGQQAGLKMDRHELEKGKPMKVRLYKVVEIPKTVIYVSSLPFKSTAKTVGNFFEHHGDIVGVEILFTKNKVKEKKAAEKCCRAIVEFADETSTNSALKDHQKATLDGCVLSITRSKRYVSNEGKRKWENISRVADQPSMAKHSRPVRMTMFKPRSVARK